MGSQGGPLMNNSDRGESVLCLEQHLGEPDSNPTPYFLDSPWLWPASQDGEILPTNAAKRNMIPSTSDAITYGSHMGTLWFLGKTLWPEGNLPEFCLKNQSTCTRSTRRHPFWITYYISCIIVLFPHSQKDPPLSHRCKVRTQKPYPVFFPIKDTRIVQFNSQTGAYLKYAGN